MLCGKGWDYVVIKAYTCYDRFFCVSLSYYLMRCYPLGMFYARISNISRFVQTGGAHVTMYEGGVYEKSTRYNN